VCAWQISEFDIERNAHWLKTVAAMHPYSIPGKSFFESAVAQFYAALDQAPITLSCGKSQDLLTNLPLKM
jgi:hypothetical protein